MGTVREGEGEMICENGTETYTLPSVKQIASGSLMHDAGSPKPVLCGNLERCSGLRGGFKREGHMCTYGQFKLMYVKNHHTIVK